MIRRVDVFLVPEDFSTLRAAVDAIINPTTIVIAPGDYAESISVAGKTRCSSKRTVVAARSHDQWTQW